MRRIRGRASLTSMLQNFASERIDCEAAFPTLIAKASVFVACALVVIIIAYLTLNVSKETTSNRETVRSRIVYYRRTVEFVAREDVVYYRTTEIDEDDGYERIIHRRVGRRLLTKDLLSSNVKADDTSSVYREGRDYFAETGHYGEYRSQRSSDSGIKTVTVVRGNDINSDIEENEIKEEPNGKPVTKPAGKHPPEVTEDMSDMDMIYLKTLEICEEQNAGNSTSHGNGSSSHGGKCASEAASAVPALWVVLYIVIILFLFIGLAIICDDFFIASLEAISEKLNLSEDVAGATFMAAGSSAPELFISVAGAGAGSDVGVGTIVGSAVFNLLIIIALTASLAGKVLCLDWRPFVRDSIFYSLSIVAFIAFSMDTFFEFWEALLLLALYVLYIVVMKFNSNLMSCMGKWKCCACFESSISPEDTSPQESKDNVLICLICSACFESRISPEDTPPQESKDTTPKSSTPVTSKPVSRSTAQQPSTSKTKADVPGLPTQKIPPSPSKRAVPITASTATLSPASTARLSPPTTLLKPKVGTPSPKRNNNTTAKSGPCNCGSAELMNQPQICTCCVIHISSQPCLPCATRLSPSLRGIPRIRCSSCSSVNEEVLVVHDQPPGSRNESGNFMRENDVIEVKETYLPNTAYSESRMQRSVSLVTLDPNRTTSPANRAANNNSSNRRCPKCNGANGDVKVISENFEESAIANVQAPASEGAKDGAEEPEIVVLPCLPTIKNSPPIKPNSSQCIAGSKYVLLYGVYLLSFPWVCLFTWTVPKCNTPQKRKWYLASFFLCIAWIAFVSWIMIEMVEKIGCLLNIDTYTMGLVVVAVGTSVPDAISSVLVAKDGYGDMAVSNALGSNVFDINLGLGLPFFIGSLITSKPISLMSPLQTCLFEKLPLPFRIVPHVKFGLILLLVLIVAVGVFMFVRFRLTKHVTILFIIMYIAFMIYAFVQEKKCYSFFC